MKVFFSKGIIVLAVAACVGSFSGYALTGKPMPKFFGGNNNQHENNNDNKDDKDKNKKDKIDLKIDSQCHYYNYDPSNENSIKEGELAGYFDVGCFFDGQPFGTWEATDLGRQKFFNFADVKPGDRGEDTISLHTTGGDGCGEIIFKNIKDIGNDCTEPETQTKDPDCKKKEPGKIEKHGELREAMEFSLWLDQGRTPGFQGQNDPGEGDNIYNEKDLLIMDWKNIHKYPSVEQIRKHIRLARKAAFAQCQAADPDGDGKNTQSGVCAGLPRDGRMLSGTVYYYGFGWRLPAEIGNEVQTDSLVFDMAFSVKSNQACTPCANQCYECDSKCSD